MFIHINGSSTAHYDTDDLDAEKIRQIIGGLDLTKPSPMFIQSTSGVLTPATWPQFFNIVKDERRSPAASLSCCRRFSTQRCWNLSN